MTTEHTARRSQLLPIMLWCCMLALTARAQPAQLQLTLEPKQQLSRSAHTPIVVQVQLPEASKNLPLLLTPHIEGAAVELVRGRLMRSDAKQADATHLRFEIPVVARSEGTAILSVSVSSYLCDETCGRIELTKSAILVVH